MKVVVTSPSFSKSKFLKDLLSSYFDNVVFNEDGIRYSGQALKEYIADADAAIIGLELIDDGLLSYCTNLKIVSKYGVGLDNIDKNACVKHGVSIGWKAGVNRTSVAEHALALMLNLSHNISATSNQIRNGVWNKAGGQQLSNKTIGIIGVGNIGKELIKMLKAFNCKILVNDIIDQSDYYIENNLTEVSKDELIAKSDIISIHTPANDEMVHFINQNNISKMKPSVFIINTARGKIVKTTDLISALNNKQIASCALDVFEEEPNIPKELYSLPHVICTPHIAGNAKEAVLAMGKSAIEQLVEITKR